MSPQPPGECSLVQVHLAVNKDIDVRLVVPVALRKASEDDDGSCALLREQLLNEPAAVQLIQGIASFPREVDWICRTRSVARKSPPLLTVLKQADAHIPLQPLVRDRSRHVGLAHHFLKVPLPERTVPEDEP